MGRAQPGERKTVEGEKTRGDDGGGSGCGMGVGGRKFDVFEC
jgi:hypothetical protein